MSFETTAVKTAVVFCHIACMREKTAFVAGATKAEMREVCR